MLLSRASSGGFSDSSPLSLFFSVRSLAYHKWNWRYLDGYFLFWLMFVKQNGDDDRDASAARLRFAVADCAVLQRFCNFMVRFDTGNGKKNGVKLGKYSRTNKQKTTDNWGTLLRFLSAVVRRLPSPVSQADDSGGETIFLPPTASPDAVPSGIVLARQDVVAIFRRQFLGDPAKAGLKADEVAAMIQHVTWEDASLTRRVSKFLLREWREAEYAVGQANILALLRRLITEEPTSSDSVLSARVQYVLDWLAETGRSGKRQSPRRVAGIVRFFLNVIRDSAAARDWSKEHEDQWAWMQDWMEDHPEFKP
jgi:hypothetical protein